MEIYLNHKIVIKYLSNHIDKEYGKYSVISLVKIITAIRENGMKSFSKEILELVERLIYSTSDLFIISSLKILSSFCSCTSTYKEEYVIDKLNKLYPIVLMDTYAFDRNITTSLLDLLCERLDFKKYQFQENTFNCFIDQNLNILKESIKDPKSFVNQLDNFSNHPNSKIKCAYYYLLSSMLKLFSIELKDMECEIIQKIEKSLKDENEEVRLYGLLCFSLLVSSK